MVRCWQVAIRVRYGPLINTYVGPASIIPASTIYSVNGFVLSSKAPFFPWTPETKKVIYFSLSPSPFLSTLALYDMSEALRICPSSGSLRSTCPSDSSRVFLSGFSNSLAFSLTLPFSSSSSLVSSREIARTSVLTALSQEGSLQDLDDSPVSVQLQPICSESQFDGVIAEAQQLEDAVIILWMATWCRKCIYLKPKLEKLAAEYYPGLRFYCVDVNTVSHKIVARAGVTKMPTIQLWKDGQKQAEVIGGHRADLVINEVREMIENDQSSI